jgi:hypothetical protein
MSSDMKNSDDRAAWLSSSNPWPMLRILQTLEGSDRKLLLFGCVCCRRIWDLVQDPRSRQGVEAVEAFVDGQLDPQTTERAYLAALYAAEERKDYAHWACMFPATHEYLRQLERGGHYQFLLTAYPFLGGDHHMHCAWHAAYMAASAASPVESEVLADEELAAQASLLRDLFGDPFGLIDRSPDWATPQILSLAQAAYEHRVAADSSRPGYLLLDRARLAVLADALEEAGCTTQEVLQHLREPRDHARGCWAVDLLLDHPLKGQASKRMPQWNRQGWEEVEPFGE